MTTSGAKSPDIQGWEGKPSGANRGKSLGLQRLPDQMPALRGDKPNFSSPVYYGAGIIVMAGNQLPRECDTAGKLTGRTWLNALRVARQLDSSSWRRILSSSSEPRAG